MSVAFQRVALFFFLFTVFYLPYIVSHSDRVLSGYAVHCLGFQEANPLGLWPENVVVAFDFLVGGFGVIGFLFMDRQPRLASLLVLFWAVYVFIFGVVLHDNVLKVAVGGCAYGGR